MTDPSWEDFHMCIFNIFSKNESHDLAQKRVFELKMAQDYAKLAREKAITKRIRDSHEVVIEEIYETEKAGDAGLKADQNGLSLHASGDARRVIKQIYRFVTESVSENY